MAQNITLLGASYSDVPSILLPKTGGGQASFTDVTDTTATASDVASGKYFYAADGTRTLGTSSGGGGGGGASNFISGEFLVPAYSSSAPRVSVTLPYSGSGYPIAGIIYVKNGMYNSSGETTWYDGIKRYAVGFWSFSKANTTTAPTFSSSTQDQVTVVGIYKNSTSSNTSYTRNSYTNSSIFSTSNVSSNSFSCVQFRRDVKTLQYSIANGTTSTYGLYPGVNYVYNIIYSE